MDEDGWHRCHFCGDEVKDGKDGSGKRHWLSDCRPDLVKHEIGPTCTWYGLETNGMSRFRCYAYEAWDKDGRHWTTEHTHFYEDGPM